jgi:hypothetical protein
MLKHSLATFETVPYWTRRQCTMGRAMIAASAMRLLKEAA